MNIRAANTFSWNDFAANLGIVVSGGLVAWLGTIWPDLVVGVIVAGIAAWAGVGFLKEAHGEHPRRCTMTVKRVQTAPEIGA